MPVIKLFAISPPVKAKIHSGELNPMMATPDLSVAPELTTALAKVLASLLYSSQVQLRILPPLSIQMDLPVPYYETIFMNCVW